MTTGDEAIAGRARRLRNYGLATRDAHEEAGENSRLDPLQAAFLRVKLAALERWNARRAAIAAAYLEGLADVPELALPPAASGEAEPVWHLFCVRHPRRNELRDYLADREIETLVHYPVPPHRSPAFADLDAGPGSFPVAEAAAATALSLPMGPHLGDDGVRATIAAVRGFAGA